MKKILLSAFICIQVYEKELKILVVILYRYNIYFNLSAKAQPWFQCLNTLKGARSALSLTIGPRTSWSAKFSLCTN